jgi:hypothetical protein
MSIFKNSEEMFFGRTEKSGNENTTIFRCEMTA